MDSSTVDYRPAREVLRVRRFYGFYLLLSVMWVAMRARSFVGSGPSTSVPWTEVKRLVVEARTSPYGTKVAIEVETPDGRRDSIPSNALAGLEDDKHAAHRDSVLKSLAQCAVEAGVEVVVSAADDPLA